MTAGARAPVFGSSLAATGIALLLPWLFQRLGADPAFGSGPLATVLQDIFTIAIYFIVASPDRDVVATPLLLVHQRLDDLQPSGPPRRPKRG